MWIGAQQVRICAVMNSRLREVSENVRRLVEEAASPASVRERAEAVRDLLDLAITWPVPSALGLDADIGSRLPDLCGVSGIPLCNSSQCAAPRNALTQARCPIVSN